MSLPASPYGPQPLFHLSGRPVWTAMLLTVVHVVMWLLTSRPGSELSALLEVRILPVDAERHILWPQWWQWGTYFFSHSLGGLFLLDMYILWVFGTQLEQAMGRKVLLALYVALIMLPSAIVAAGKATGLIEFATLAGSGRSHFCLYLAVVCLDPDASGPFGLRQKAMAGIFFGIYALSHLYMKDGLGLILLMANAAATYISLRKAGVSPRFERVASAFSAAMPRSRRKGAPAPVRYEPKIVPRPELREERVAVAKVDAILEKISRSGIDSLTTDERKQLERASTELKRQDG